MYALLFVHQGGKFRNHQMVYRLSETVYFRKTDADAAARVACEDWQAATRN